VEEKENNMVAALPKYSYDDFKLWEGDWELIEGHPVAMAPSPVGKHQKLMLNIGYLLKEALDEEDCECEAYPELDWIIDNSNVLRPDLAVYCEDVEEYPKTTPKIVVEIISPSTAKNDEELKYGIYEREGVGYYLLVYPDLGKVRIFQLQNDNYKKVYEGEGRFRFGLCGIEIDFGKVF